MIGYRSSAVLFVFMLLLCTGCERRDSSATSTADAPADRDIRMVVITHGQAADPNWSVFQNGVDRAGRDMDVRVEYQAPESFDMVAMAQLIDAAVASDPDGLIVTIPDVDALRTAIRSAIESGIPVISVNSGSTVAEELGTLVHVGQTEYEAGYEAGQRMAKAGVEHALCVNMEVGNVALDRRCEGVRDALEEVGRRSEVLAVELADPTETEQRIYAALNANASVDGLITLGPTSAGPALKALENFDGGNAVKLATFDLSPEIISAIEAEDIMFAVDQQFYLQGYMPVVLMTMYVANRNTLANEVIKTGPGFVTPENVVRLKELTSRGTR